MAKNIKDLADDFILELELKGYSKQTIYNYDSSFRDFFKFIDKRKIEDIDKADRKILEKYHRRLYKSNIKPISQSMFLINIMMFFRWLLKNDHILYNPTDSLDLPKLPDRLPANVLTLDEVEQVFNQADLTKPYGIRDRAILETFFATGMRRRELVFLSLADIDFEKKLVLIKHGKGNKERFVPISSRALDWIKKYIEETRSLFILAEKKSDTLFLSSSGEAFKPRSLARRMRNYINQANIGKKGSCHIFRHTLATMMLENGASLRYIQEMLGHTQLSSTQIYTRVSIAKLKEVHNKTHPGAATKDEL